MKAVLGNVSQKLILTFLFKAMTFRKEDYDVNRPQSEMEDILQYNNKPRTTMYRGVQLPAGFMATAGGIDHVS